MRQNVYSAALFATILILISTPSRAEEPSQSAPDNSGINERDRVDNAKTADHQIKSNKSSTEVTRMIRLAITEDSSFSTSAHNIKIITNSSTVTLRGPIKNADEKIKIENIALKYANNRTIQNKLELKQQ